jgi:hypothetical protein
MSILPHSPIDRLTLDDVLERLHGVKKAGSGYSARCPAHDDKSPSLSVRQGDDGKVLVKCHAGCSFESICTHLGVQQSQLFASSESAPPRLVTRSVKPKLPAFSSPDASVVIDRTTAAKIRDGWSITARWNYHDENGAIVGIIARLDKDGQKTFLPFVNDGVAWRCGAMPAPRPLYRLCELVNAKSRELLVVVEGEKCADAAASIGLMATTSVGGSQAARQSDWKICASFKEIWVIPDNDAAGLRYVNDVEGLIRRHDAGAVVRMFGLPGVVEGGDIADWLETRGDAASPADIVAELRRLAEASAQEHDEDEDELPGWVPFPVDALPMVARQFVSEGAAAIGCDASFLTLPLLTMAGAALGANRWLEVKPGWRVPPILWSAIIGRSGTNKSPALNLISGLLVPVMKQWRDQYRIAMEGDHEAGLQYEKRVQAWSRKKESNDVPAPRPAPPAQRRLVVTDTTIEQLTTILAENPRGLVLVRDELDGWLQSFTRYSGSSDKPFWLNCYSGLPHPVDRRGRGVVAFLDCPLVAVCGGIQPEIMRSRMRGENQDSGLLARFVVACPPPMLRRWRKEIIKTTTREGMANAMLQLVEAEESTLILSVEAENSFSAWVDANGLVIADATDAEAACLSKIEELPARLAVILHSLDDAAGMVVSGATMQAAIRLAEWFRQEKLRWHRSTEPDENERLIQLVKNAGEAGLTAREATRRCSWLRKSGAADKALSQLCRDGVLISELINPPHGGRPRIVYRPKTEKTS